MPATDSQAFPGVGSPGETCDLNTGKATYEGVEGESTYAFTGQSLGDWSLDGLSIFASGSINSSKSNHLYIKQAPLWTEADGIVYKFDMFKLSLIDKLVGQQYSDTANTQFYKLHAYNNMDFKASMDIENYELSVGIYNVLNQRNLLSTTINDKTTIGANVYNIAARGSSLDQYYFAPPINFQVSLKARF